MVEFIRRHDGEVKIVVGGPLIANHARNYEGEELKAALRDIGADIYIVEGQGELTLTRVVERLRNGDRLDQIPNLLYFEDGRLRGTGHEPESNSLEENFIDWSQLAPAPISVRPSRPGRREAVRSSAPFCNYPTRAGSLTLASLDTLLRAGIGLDAQPRQRGERRLQSTTPSTCRCRASRTSAD